MKRFISYLIFYLLQFTWGILMNIFGIIVAIIMLISLHKPHILGPSIYFACKKAEGFGFEAGIFFVVGADCNPDEYIMLHEAGHGIQNIILGPFTIILSFIPSLIRYWYREIKYYKKGIEPPTDYSAIWFEHQADVLGKKIYQKIYDRKFKHE